MPPSSQATWTSSRSSVRVSAGEADDVVWLVFSRLLGEARGERRFTRSVCVALAGLAGADQHALGLPGPVPLTGWSDGRTVLARLAVEPSAIDVLWQRALSRDGTRALLPGPLVRAFFPARVWPAAVAAVHAGPMQCVELLERFARAESLRVVAPTRARPAGGTVSAATIDGVIAGGRRFMAAVAWLSGRGLRFPGWQRWQYVPPTAGASMLGAEPAGWDRSAPPLATVRAALERLAFEVTASGGIRRVRALRNRLLLGLLACTGARIGAVARLRVRDYTPSHRFPNGDVGPAVALRPGKTLHANAVRWKALPAELARWLEQYVAEAGLEPAAPLFPRRGDPREQTPMSPASLTKILSGETRRSPGGYRRPLLPHPDDPRLGYSAHTLRHLAARLAYTVARRGLGEDGLALPPQAYLDSLLDHASSADRLGYLDTTSEAARETLSRHAALAIWPLLRGHADAYDRTIHHLETTIAALRHTRRELLAGAASRPGQAAASGSLATVMYLDAAIDDAQAALTTMTSHLIEIR